MFFRLVQCAKTEYNNSYETKFSDIPERGCGAVPRAVVFSDSHGDYDVLERIMERHRENAELFIHLGDGERELEYLRYIYPEKKILFVRGNCDYASEAPDYDIAYFAGKRIFFTHGYLYGVKGGTEQIIAKAQKHAADILLFGHTHLPLTERSGELYIMNPGSCSRPRSGAPSYGVIDFTDSGIFMYTTNI